MKAAGARDDSLGGKHALLLSARKERSKDRPDLCAVQGSKHWIRGLMAAGTGEPFRGGSICMWEPINEDALMSLMAVAESAMEPQVLGFWERMRIRPVKWALPPWADMGGGFWVVAVVGHECIWYNDIEDGFNVSTYSTPGVIHEYRCNQDELQYTIYKIFRQIDAGESFGFSGPPEPLT